MGILRELDRITEYPPTAYASEIEAAAAEIRRLRLALADITHYRGNDLDAIRRHARKTLDTGREGK
jgi:hypothetical protein